MKDQGNTQPSKQATACRRERGVTLIESVLFISVALGLIVGGLVFYQQSVLAARTQELIRLSNAIVSEVRFVYGRNRAEIGRVAEWDEGFRDMIASFMGEEFVNYQDALRAGSATPVLISSAAIPADNIVGSQIVSPWRQPIEATVARVNNRNTLYLDFYNLPISVCTRVATVDDQQTSILADKVFMLGFNGGNFESGVVPPNLAAQRCREAGGSGAVRVTVGIEF